LTAAEKFSRIIEREKMQKIKVGDVVQVVDGYGSVQQIVGKNIKILLSGRYGDGEWYTFDQIVSHAALSPKRGASK
jgi:hypothetical protein